MRISHDGVDTRRDYMTYKNVKRIATRILQFTCAIYYTENEDDDDDADRLQLANILAIFSVRAMQCEYRVYMCVCAYMRSLFCVFQQQRNTNVIIMFKLIAFF